MTRAVTRSGRVAGQMQEELNAFIAFLVERRANIRGYLEIGARYGDTFYDVVRAVRPAFSVALDLPGNKWGTVGSDSDLRAAVAALGDEGHKCCAYFADSQRPATVNVVTDLFVRAIQTTPDAVLIDGDHRFDPCMSDYRNYGYLARYCAFHDIVGHGQRHDRDNYVEVPQVWEEVSRQTVVRRAHEFVAPGSKMGIGVVEHEW